MIYLPNSKAIGRVIRLWEIEQKAPPNPPEPPKDSPNAKPPSRPNQAQFAKVCRATGRKLDRLAQQLAAGDLRLTDFQELCLDVLEEGHGLAAALGRRRAGDPVLVDGLDALRARQVMRNEREYFKAFVEQLRDKDKRYVDPEFGTFDPDKIASRSRGYIGKMRGTANNAFVDTSQVYDLFDWVMLAAEHCSQCPELQAGSPYKRDELPTRPGAGETPCRQNCGCVLVRHDGIVGFARYNDPSQHKLKPGAVGNDTSGGDVPVIDVTHDDPRLAEWMLV